MPAYRIAGRTFVIAPRRVAVPQKIDRALENVHPIFLDEGVLDPDAPRFVVHGCPLMTNVTAAHAYFGGFTLQVPLLRMRIGQKTTGRCGDREYVVERVS